MWRKGSSEKSPANDFTPQFINKQLGHIEKQIIATRDSQAEFIHAKEQEMQFIFQTLAKQNEELAHLHQGNQAFRNYFVAPIVQGTSDSNHTTVSTLVQQALNLNQDINTQEPHGDVDLELKL